MTRLEKLETPKDKKRFWDKVDKSGPIHPELGVCWVWTGCVEWNDYGRFSFQGKMHYAHRIAYCTEIGTVPEGLDLDHLCRNRTCVRPLHLEPVTRSENILRGKLGEVTKARRANVMHCSRGHLYTEENTYISPQNKRECRICKNRRWRELYKRKKAQCV